MSASSAADVLPDRPSRDELLNLLQGEIEPVKKSPLYGFGLLLVAVVMVLLPVIYVGLIGLVGYLTYFHATTNVGIMGGGGFRIRLLLYLAPIIAGAVVCLFMVKPLFARPPRAPQPFFLAADKEPLLFAWVERLSRLIGAPMPKRIDVNCEVNASASFRRGLLSMFGRDLVLTIGLPLMAGMSLRQFTGVLAHELGHFAQGGGMRLSYIIRSVNHWFARVVYERDSLDMAIADAQQNSSLGIMVVVGISRGGVWLSRRILWVLMQFGHLISCFLLRQMEFDADRYEARVAGSEVFGETVTKLHELMIGQKIAMNDLALLWSEKKLPDDLPGFSLAKTARLEKQVLQQYMDGVLEQKTSWSSTHPANQDRIESARRENSPGLLRTALESSILVTDFAEIGRRVTAAHYEVMLGGQVESRYLNPTSELLAVQENEAERRLGLHRFFQGGLDGEDPFFPSQAATQVENDPEALRSALEQVRAGLLESRGGKLAKRRDLVDQRLRLALELLTIPEVANDLDSSKASNEQAASMLAVLNCLEKVQPDAAKLSQTNLNIFRHVQLLQQHPNEEKIQQGFRTLVERLRAHYLKIRSELDEVTYPFSHTDGEISCAGYAAPGQPPRDDPGSVIESTQRLLDLFSPLYQRTLSRLVEMAEIAEDAVGLERLEAPPIEQAQEDGDGDGTSAEA